jgi:uncharacterized protein
MHSPSTTTVSWLCPDVDPFIDFSSYAINGDLEAVRSIMNTCVTDPTDTTHDDMALARAGQYGQGDVVSFLIDAGADPGFVDTQGTSVLMWATRASFHAEGEIARPGPADAAAKAEVARVLIDHEIDLDHKGEGGNTALHWAAHNGYEEMIRVLLNAGADFEVATDEDWTPLMAAAANNLPATVEALLTAGADPSREDSRGLTAVEVADERGYTEVVEVLTGD